MDVSQQPFVKGMISPDRVREIEALFAKVETIIADVDPLVQMGLFAYLAARWVSMYDENDRGERFGDFSELVADLTKSMS